MLKNKEKKVRKVSFLISTNIMILCHQQRTIHFTVKLFCVNFRVWIYCWINKRKFDLEEMNVVQIITFLAVLIVAVTYGK